MSSRQDEVWPYYAKRPLSHVEQILYYRLIQALPQHMVLAQVSLSRLLGVQRGHPHLTWFNRINCMSADFVVCGKDASVVAVIELDDASHRLDERIKADAKKDKALASAGISVVRWPVKPMPDVAAIQATLHPLFVKQSRQVER